jgi:CheY-like chemotaxis protein
MIEPKPAGVLVVDDDPGVRKVLTAVLQRYGCAVWSAGDGRTAVRVYEQNRAEVGVVLLDVCMPGLDGPQTLDALRAVDPGVRAMFMTGDPGYYTIEELRRRGMAVLHKPFTDLAALAGVLQEAAAA